MKFCYLFLSVLSEIPLFIYLVHANNIMLIYNCQLYLHIQTEYLQKYQNRYGLCV